MPVQLLLGALVGFAGGVLSGFFGIGGGLVIVPGLMLLLDMTIKQAAGTSLAAFLSPAGLIGAWQYWQEGYVDVGIAVAVGIGLIVGALVGARVAIGLPPEVVQRAFGILLVLVGIRMALVVGS
jgi:uncharacterized membrane protein YfcA